MALTPVSVGAVRLGSSLTLDGNIGYFFTRNENDGGSKSDSSNLVAALNARTYLWQPWFGTLDLGGVTSLAKSDADTVDSETKLVSSRVQLKLLPKSRYPFDLTFNSSDNVVEWINRDKPLLADLGTEYRSRYLNIRQSYITLGGNRLDGWYSRRLRGIDNTGENKDTTYGMKIKWRLKDQNFYFKGSRGKREQSEIDSKIKSDVLSLTHQYVPGAEFYIKSLVTSTKVDNKTENTNGSFLYKAGTSVRQAVSFFYWRPQYKPLSTTGAIRIQRRTVDFNNDSPLSLGSSTDDQSHFFANIAGNYQINKKAKLTATANVSSLDTERNNRLASAQSVSVNYRSDRYLFRGFDYYWYTNGGIGNEVEAQFSNTSFSQNTNIGVGHNLHRRWITGNRATVTANATQALREFLMLDDFDSALTVTHSGSMTWKNGRTNRGSSFAQLSLLDSRNFDQDLDTQIVTGQLSHTKPINRLSSYGGHLTLQSTRRSTEFFDRKRFLTTSTGRLSYRHQRIFGIYRLKFRGKFDLSTTANRDGGDRKQWRLEGRLSYAVGMLNTSVLARWVDNDIGLGSKLLVFQLNRSF